MPLDVSSLSRADFREYLRKADAGGMFLASWTPTKKDDIAIELFSSIVENDDQFGKLCDLLGLPDSVKE